MKSLKKSLGQRSRIGPSAGFLEHFRKRRNDPAHQKAVKELFDRIESGRKSKKPIVAL